MWGILFTAVWSGIKAFFGKSDQEKLGIAEEKEKSQAEMIEKIQTAQNLAIKYDSMGDSALRIATKQWERTDHST